MKRIKIKKSNYLHLLSLLFAVLFILAVPAKAETLEDQVNDISGELLCPVCRGQSVAESNSALAQDMRTTIRQKLKEGQSKEQIIAYFKASYGDSILSSPPLKGINIFLWMLPVLSLSIGAVFTFYILKNYKKGSDDKNYSLTTRNKYLDKIEDEMKNSE